MLKELSHADCLKIIENPSTQNILESLGLEYSDRGLAEYRGAQTNIFPSLVKAIVEKLKICPVFPARYQNHRPDVGVYIRMMDQSFVVFDIDKPSIWQEKLFATPEAAARSYIRRVVDAYWLKSDAEEDTPPKSVFYSWLQKVN